MSRLLEIDAYLAGELDEAGADALEEALFASPDDPDLALLDRLARDGARLVRDKAFYAGITRQELDELRAAGHVVEVVEVGPPGLAKWGMGELAELVVTRMELGRPDLGRVDIELALPDAGVTKIIRDVCVDPVDGAIYGLCERPLAKIAFGAGRTLARVRQRDGARTVVAEWTFVT